MSLIKCDESIEPKPSMAVLCRAKELKEEISALQALVDELQTALDLFGNHSYFCKKSTNLNDICTCGYEDSKVKIQEVRRGT